MRTLRWYMFLRSTIAALSLLFLAAPLAHGQVLTPDLEIKLIPNVGSPWQTVSLENSYSDAIVVCSYNLPSSASPPAVTRIQNITANSFQLRAQLFANSGSVTPSNVHCIIADEGPYDSGGLKYEARKVLSTGTSGLAVPGNWGVAVGKHIGQVNDTRADEWLGYITIEAGTGTVNDITFAAAVGPDTGGGVGNNPPYSYSVTGDFDIAVVTDAGEDGGHGGWSTLYGADPLPSGQIRWAIDEETVAGDMTRTHTTENVGYWIFDNNQRAQLAAKKSVAMFSGNASNYSIPGSDVIYTIKVGNEGSGAVDQNSIFFVDTLPPEVSFYNGDIDDGGPLTGVTDFDAGDSDLTFTEATDLGFATGTTAPTDMSQCNYAPSAGYDPNVKFICFAPKGTMSEGTITSSTFSVGFRATIK